MQRSVELSGWAGLEQPSPCFCPSGLKEQDAWGAPDHDSSCLQLAEPVLAVRALRLVLRWVGHPVGLGPAQSHLCDRREGTWWPPFSWAFLFFGFFSRSF